MTGNQRSSLPSRLWPFYTDEAIQSVSAMLAAGDSYMTVDHERVSYLENEFKNRFHPNSWNLFVGTGTGALLAGYYGLNLPSDSEVLVPAYTFHATITPLLQLGIRPVLCDVDPGTGLLDLEDARRRISNRTKALVVTHLWGQLVDTQAARKFCDDYGLFLVEDCSHAHGRSNPDKTYVGDSADFAVYSLGTKKIISGGLGGMLVTASDRIFERAVLLTQPKPRADALLDRIASPLRQYTSTGLGLNLRGSPVSALLAGDHLDRLTDIVQVKNRNLRQASRLLQEFIPNFAFTEVPDDDRGTLYMLTGLADGVDDDQLTELLSTLKTAGIRISRAPAGLQNTTIASDPLNLLKHEGNFICSGDYPAVRYIEHRGIRLDTRDMYVPWSDEDFNMFSLALQRSARLGRRQ